MKKIRLFYVMSIVLIMSMVVMGCAKKDSSSNEAYDKADGLAYGTSGETKSVAPEEAPAAGSFDTTADFDEDGLKNSTAFTLASSTNVQSQDKIIQTVYMDVETQEFDTLITELDSEISRLNGYVESSRISGRSYYDSEGARYASIIARIPRDKANEFVSSVGESANVINKQETTENVTLQYTDVESRKKSLEIEQERLFVLLEKTDSLENIVTLESRLSDIRYELQNYETTLRTYDNKVEYSTITLSVQEVERITPKVEIKQTVGTRIQNGFSDTMFNLSEGLKNFFVWFVVNLPYLVIWGIIFAVIALIVRRALKKKEKNNLTQNAPTPPKPPMDNQD